MEEEWGSDIVFSHGTNQKAGVAMLIGKKLAVCQVENKICDSRGRYIILEIRLNNELITIKYICTQ